MCGLRPLLLIEPLSFEPTFAVVRKVRLLSESWLGRRAVTGSDSVDDMVGDRLVRQGALTADSTTRNGHDVPSERSSPTNSSSTGGSASPGRAGIRPGTRHGQGPSTGDRTNRPTAGLNFRCVVAECQVWRAERASEQIIDDRQMMWRFRGREHRCLQPISCRRGYITPVLNATIMTQCSTSTHCRYSLGPNEYHITARRGSLDGGEMARVRPVRSLISLSGCC